MEWKRGGKIESEKNREKSREEHKRHRYIGWGLYPGKEALL